MIVGVGLYAGGESGDVVVCENHGDTIPLFALGLMDRESRHEWPAVCETPSKVGKGALVARSLIRLDSRSARCPEDRLGGVLNLIKRFSRCGLSASDEGSKCRTEGFLRGLSVVGFVDAQQTARSCREASWSDGLSAHEVIEQER